MPPLRETGKERASRIPLDYYKKPDAMVRWKKRLSIAALVATGLYLVSAFVLPGFAESRYSHGPVHAVHMAWEDRCEVCHVSFQPIKQDTWLSSWTPSGRVTADTSCQSCHEGPVHRKNTKDEDVGSCASCHRDHRGREASMVNLPDSDCVRCHRDLKTHFKPDAAAGELETKFQDVNAFSIVGHKEFALFRPDKDHPEKWDEKGNPIDPGKLKFNHALHMRPGQTTDKDAKPWTLREFKSKEDQDRYGAAQPPNAKELDSPVQLSCASCHQPEGTGDARTSGNYMAPVTYDQNCKACHPLTYNTSKSPIPHHLQPSEVRSFLWGALAQDKVKDPELLKRLTGPIPLPGKLTSEEERKAREELDAATAVVEKFVYQNEVAKMERYIYSGKTTCGECHHFEGQVAASPRPAGVTPTRVPVVWFKDARFSHRAHGAVTCVECHKKAPTSETSSDVLLEKMESCVSCHGPASSADGKAVGGVRSNCTECHFYHNGDKPLSGLGASGRDAKIKRNFTDFLNGTKESPP